MFPGKSGNPLWLYKYRCGITIVHIETHITICTKYPMNFIIVDIECTCDEPTSYPRDEMEIIEIGAVHIDLRLDRAKITSSKQIYVKPVIHPGLTNFCTALTGITQSQVDQAVALPAALQSLRTWLDTVSPAGWGSWGKFDATQFELECHKKSITNPLAQLNHLNIKQIFAKKRGHRVGLARALALRKLQFQGQQHSGIDDAINIARLLDNDDLLREAALDRVLR